MSIQDKFNRANVIYKITKDIDLGGETLTIPEGCTLDFQGGSFSNGTIVGGGTVVEAPFVKIFSLDVKLEGYWKILESYPEWFGADVKNVDNSDFFQAAINFAKYSKLAISQGIYNFKKNLILNKSLKIEGCNASNVVLNFDADYGIVVAPDDHSEDEKGNTFYNINDITIYARKNAIRIECTTTTQINYVALTNICRCNLNAEFSICLNNPHNTDGLFLCNISYNKCNGGLYLDRIGDSNWICYNKISGEKEGIFFRSIASLGAARNLLANNNITSKGAAIKMIDCMQAVIEGNQIEHYGQDSIGAVIDIGNNDFRCNDIIIRDNNINGRFNSLSLITLANSYNCLISHNELHGTAEIGKDIQLFNTENIVIEQKEDINIYYSGEVPKNTWVDIYPVNGEAVLGTTIKCIIDRNNCIRYKGILGLTLKNEANIILFNNIIHQRQVVFTTINIKKENNEIISLPAYVDGSGLYMIIPSTLVGAEIQLQLDGLMYYT